MTHREQWEETSFQVFTDEDGVLRSGWYPTGNGLVDGNVQVDKVWGNMPLQPDDDRSDNGYSFGGGAGDEGWDATYSYTSDTLRTADYTAYYNNVGGTTKVPADSHTIATTGWSNYPGFIPNYAGDGDTNLEVVVPNLLRLDRNAAQNLLSSINLDWNNSYENPQVNYVESNGKTVRVWVDALFGLKNGDQVWPDNNVWNYSGQQVITLVGEDEVDGFWMEFEAEEIVDPALNDEAMGVIWPGDNTYNKIMVQNPSAGDIANEGDEIQLTILGD